MRNVEMAPSLSPTCTAYHSIRRFIYFARELTAYHKATRLTVTSNIYGLLKVVYQTTRQITRIIQILMFFACNYVRL